MRLIILLFSLYILIAHAADFKLKSNSFSDNKKIPESYSCDGKGFSPQLSWSGVPEKTQSFALIVSDPDAPSGTWYHWILYNIPSSISSLDENIQKLPEGTLTGKNSAEKSNYFPPCPPPGNPHHYIFTLYALDALLNLSGDVDQDSLEKAMEGHVLAKTTLTGLFTR